MKQIKNQNRYRDYTNLVLLGVLLILPCIFLYHSLSELIKRDETQLVTIAKEKLILEIEAFQNSLSPEKYIENAMRDFNRKMGFAVRYAGIRELIHQPENGDDLISATFCDDLKSFLRKQYELIPLLIVAADTDLQNSYSWYNPDEVIDDSHKDLFEKITVFSYANPRSKILTNVLPHTPNLHELWLSKGGWELDTKQSKAILHLQDNYTRLFNEFLSSFSRPQYEPDKCTFFFSNYFGNQQIFHYNEQLVRENAHNQRSIFGLYYIAFHSSDLPLSKILRDSLESSENFLSREFISVPAARPFFTLDEGGLSYTSSFPAGFIQAAKDLGINHPQLSSRILDFLENHSLSVTINNEQLESKLNKYLAIVRLTAQLIFAFIIIMLLNMYLVGNSFNILLGTKLRLAVGLIIMIPIAGLFMLTELIQRDSLKLELIKHQTALELRLRKIEQMLREHDVQLVSTLLHNKKSFADLLSANYNKSGEPPAAYQIDNSMNLPVAGLFFDKDGHATVIKSNAFMKPMQDNHRLLLYRMLSELNLINENSKRIKDISGRYYLVASIFDDVFTNSANSKILSNESLIIRELFTISSLYKACFSFISFPSSPDHAEGILYTSIENYERTRRLMRYFNSSNSTLFEPDRQNDTHVGMFMRSSTEIRAYACPEASPRIDELKLLRDRAFETRTSGTKVYSEQNQHIISSWRYFEDNVVMLAGFTVFTPGQNTSLFFMLLPWVLLVYTIITATLVSDFLADMFLKPVSTLLKAVSQVTAGNFQVRTEIGSGDEFAELSTAFNSMIKGVKQRQEMQRFVSDHLLTSIQNERSEVNLDQVAILSSDVRSFTLISESNPPEEIVKVLNDYYSLMETAIIKHGGSIEKIVGDALIASFYENRTSDHSAPLRATFAAIEMLQLLKQLNQERTSNGLFPIYNGIGIACGATFPGFAGSGKRREFFLMGDSLQKSEELEGLTKHTSTTPILVCHATKDIICNHFDLNEHCFNETVCWEVISAKS